MLLCFVIVSYYIFTPHYQTPLKPYANETDAVAKLKYKITQYFVNCIFGIIKIKYH